MMARVKSREAHSFDSTSLQTIYSKLYDDFMFPFGFEKLFEFNKISDKITNLQIFEFFFNQKVDFM